MASVPQLGAPGGDDDSQEMPRCSHCGHAIFFEHAYDCPAINRQQQAAYPIPLSPEQEITVKEWAASSGMWGSQEAVEINLRTFARMVLKSTIEQCGEEHAIGSQPRSCFACLDTICESLLEVARIEQELQMRGYTKATAKQLGPEAEHAYLSGGAPGLNNWRRQKREAAIAEAESKEPTYADVPTAGCMAAAPLTHADLDEPLLEPADAGRELGVTPKQINRLADRGVLPPVARTVRGTRLFRRSDVERVREERALRKAGAR